MSIPYILLSVVYIALCGVLIAMILMQKKGSGLGNIGGMGGDSQTYWDKNKGRSFEGSLERYSKILAACLLVLSLALCFIV
jgi:preprotein translocase subunit SecG